MWGHQYAIEGKIAVISDYRFLMANVLWSDNGWTRIDPTQKGKNQFTWTKANPDNHGDGTLFRWKDLKRDGCAYVPINRNPRWYTRNSNGQGVLFVASRSIHDGQYYLVGLFSSFNIYSDSWGVFDCDERNSLRFEFYLPLDINRHCPYLLDGSPRKNHFGMNNFNYIADASAKTILEDAIQLHKVRRSGLKALRKCTFTGEAASVVLDRVHRAYFR